VFYACTSIPITGTYTQVEFIVRDVFLPGPRPEGRTTGEPKTHTQSVDNKGLLVVIRGKQGREGRREKLSSSHFNAFSHWIIIVIFMKSNNKILVFILSSILLIVDCTS
jgi:hypothetical protein